MGNVLEDIAKLIEDLNKKQSAISIAETFGRKSKDSIYAIKNGCSFRLDDKFVAGLKSYGYELKLVKKDRVRGKIRIGTRVRAFECNGIVLAIDRPFLWVLDEYGEVAEWDVKDCENLGESIDILPIINFARNGG